MFTDEPELVQVKLSQEDELIEGLAVGVRGILWEQIRI